MYVTVISDTDRHTIEKICLSIVTRMFTCPNDCEYYYFTISFDFPGVFLVSASLCSYKPTLSGSQLWAHESVNICGSYPEYARLSKVLDTVYGLGITVIPFIIIAFLNSWNSSV